VSKRNDGGHVRPKSRARRLTVTLTVLAALAGTAYALATKRITVSAEKPEA
jgi:hypothetical protein